MLFVTLRKRRKRQRRPVSRALSPELAPRETVISLGRRLPGASSGHTREPHAGRASPAAGLRPPLSRPLRTARGPRYTPPLRLPRDGGARGAISARGRRAEVRQRAVDRLLRATCGGVPPSTWTRSRKARSRATCQSSSPPSSSWRSISRPLRPSASRSPTRSSSARTR